MRVFARAALFAIGGLIVSVLAIYALRRATPESSALVHIPMYRNSYAGIGVNHRETLLTPGNIGVAVFGKRFSTAVDGQVYAQPLYISNLRVSTSSDRGVYNVVFVATEHNSLYAIDGDSGKVLWQRSFIDPANGITTAATAQLDRGSSDISIEVGITATPVIDLDRNAIFVQAKTMEMRAGETHYVQHLIAIDARTGEVSRRVVIADTTFRGSLGYSYNSGPYVLGTGDGRIVVDGESRVYFNAMRQLVRPGLVLFEGNIYVASASHEDNGPYHGWLLSYDATTLTLNGALNTTPNGGLGGIWQAGGTPAIDAQGFIYVVTGNGTFNPIFDAAGFPVDGNYGNSFLKVARDPSTTANQPNANGWGLKIVDFFTPFNEEQLDRTDTDLGSGAPLLLPDSVGSPEHPHLLVAGSKEGKIYLIDRDNMGKHDPHTDRVVQQQASAIGGIFGTPAFFDGRIYFTGSFEGPVSAFTVANGRFSSVPVSETLMAFAGLAGSPVISANGTTNGILWNLDRRSSHLYAFDAADLSRRLYSSAEAADNRDQLGVVQKFSLPTVVDGRVYIGTSNSLVALGPPAPPTARPKAPSNLVATARFPTQIDFTWQDNADNEEYFVIERSPEGANAWQQVGTVGVNITTFSDTMLTPLTRLSYRVHAHNALGDSTNLNVEAVTTAATLPIGDGDGLFGQFFDTAAFTDLKLTRVDPTVNFNFGWGPPNPTMERDTFSIRWTGRLQAQFSEPYTFYTMSDDGVRLTIDGHSVIDNMTEHGATEDRSSPMVLVAGTTYRIQLDYFDGGGDARVMLSWSSPSTPKQIIPRSQLFSGVAPPAPTDLSARAASGTQVNLQWVDASKNETGFAIERRTNAQGAFRQVRLVPPNTQSYMDTALNQGETYEYRVQAMNFGENSTPGNVVSVKTPVPPITPSRARLISVTPTRIELAWSDNSTDEDAYHIFRRAGSAGTFVLVTTLPSDSTTFVDAGPNGAGLEPGTEYDYHIQARNLAGFSDFAGVSVTTLSLAPTNLRAVPGDRQITLSWTAPSGAASFNVYRATEPNGFGSTPLRVGLTAPRFTDVSLENGRTYFYQVTAVNRGGESARAADVSAQPARQRD